MKCYNCEGATRTEYPKIDGNQYVRKKCVVCGWKSYPIFVISNLEMQRRSSRHRRSNNE